MNSKKGFLIVNGQSITRACRDHNGYWLVETVLAGQGVCSLADDPLNLGRIWRPTILI